VDQIRLVDLIGRWLALDKQLQQYQAGELPFGWSDGDIKFIECRLCWQNMGWIGADRVFSNAITYEATNPSFFKDLKISLLKHTKKCKIQKY
jgi:hypothetical protein